VSEVRIDRARRILGGEIEQDLLIARLEAVIGLAVGDEETEARARAERLLEDEGVVVMPGSGFGAGGEGFFRISFIVSPDRIAEAAVRAGRVLSAMEATVG